MTPHDVKHLDGLLADLRRRQQSERPSPDTTRVVMDIFAVHARERSPVVGRRPAAVWSGRAAWRAAAAFGVASAAAWWLFAALPDRAPIAAPEAAIPPGAARGPGIDAAPGRMATRRAEPGHDVAAAASTSFATDNGFVDDGFTYGGAIPGPASFVALSPAPGAGGAVHLMRVRLPESAIWTLGLDLPSSRAEQRGFVEADVLLGEDGVARAIRIIP